MRASDEIAPEPVTRFFFTRPVVQYLPDFCRQSRETEGLDDQLHAWIEPTVVNDGILRVAGGEQNLDIGTYLASLVR